METMFLISVAGGYVGCFLWFYTVPLIHWHRRYMAKRKELRSPKDRSS
ncbi:MAG: hypothetical protein LBC71_04155 [Oscillospiraceae bacterium]|jgi:hypothetical protein|nr:hypothetical protein [Oscillospiraceae bacterium]